VTTPDPSATTDRPGRPQLAAAQVPDDEAATAFSQRHRDWTACVPALLDRGDDTGADGLDDT